MDRDDGDPDLLVAPRLSPLERAVLWRAALAATERDVAALDDWMAGY